MLNLGKPFYESEVLKYDENNITEDTVKIACSVNGKLRANFETKVNTSKEKLLELAYQQENVKNHINGKEVIKEIVVLNNPSFCCLYFAIYVSSILKKGIKNTPSLTKGVL